MIKQVKTFHSCNYSLCILVPLLHIFLSACSSGGGSSSCDTVANPDGPAFFQVENNLSSGLSWTLPDFAFGADMKPGECTIMGIPSSQITLELQQCDIGGEACISDFGQEKVVVFSVGQGETFTLTVDSDTFK